ncbi:hypothetical protein KHA94_13590 [Bacillus sp. FJAT-49705]|uniref:Uncharacterized protein n=1 Tax=Cytobacillus citreus TaxID=2833586 RepID=A0ABS5NTR3_9BACI|nr:hypothetical protein [Cytobacillus citreus]MBS4191216.1 hypothetical protein [Cytobacillus citreus]
MNERIRIAEELGDSKLLSGANKYVKVFNEFSNGNSGYQLGINALYLISKLPEEERNKEHAIPSTGKQKTVDEIQSLHSATIKGNAHLYTYK